MRYSFLLTVLILAGCNATNPKNESNVIVADGTEVQQFEAMFFCGDRDGFVAALGDVGSHLGESWKSVMGGDSQAECAVRISVNGVGEILEYEMVACEDSSRLREVIRVASPVPVPEDECLLEKVNGVSYTLNSSKEGS